MADDAHQLLGDHRALLGVRAPAALRHLASFLRLARLGQQLFGAAAREEQLALVLAAIGGDEDRQIDARLGVRTLPLHGVHQDGQHAFTARHQLELHLGHRVLHL
jgi:hypothetical protein